MRTCINVEGKPPRFTPFHSGKAINSHSQAQYTVETSAANWCTCSQSGKIGTKLTTSTSPFASPIFPHVFSFKNPNFRSASLLICDSLVPIPSQNFEIQLAVLSSDFSGFFFVLLEIVIDCCYIFNFLGERCRRSSRRRYGSAILMILSRHRKVALFLLKVWRLRRRRSRRKQR